MENRSDIEKRLGEKLEAAYMLEEIPQGMSREDFHRLIQAAEKKKKRRRNMLSLAAACVALCLMCGGFVAGMTMRESASAGKDDETKTVQQGGSVVIGSGVSEKDQNVGVSTKTYTNIEDIPEDIRKEIHFLDSDEFELEKVKVVENNSLKNYILCYFNKEIGIVEITEQLWKGNKGKTRILTNNAIVCEYKGIDVYEVKVDEGKVYFFEQGIIAYYVSLEENKIETILDGLIN